MSDHEPGLHVSATLGLPPEPRAAREARRFIVEFCDASGLPSGLCETASLLTSELVTNAVLHGRSSATLRADRPPGRLRVAIEDHNPALPEIGPSPAVSAEGGRGLQIVALLADRWGVEALDRGKAVWFELDAGESSAH